MAKFKRPVLSQKQVLERRFKSCRIDLLIIAILGALNLVLVPLIDIYFRFSAFLPPYLIIFGMTLCGKLPPEYYEGGMENYEFLDSSFLIVMIVLAAIIVGLYFLAWVMSKKHGIGWLIFALAFFSADTVAMFALGVFEMDFIFDIVFHVVSIVSLAMGLHAQVRLKDMGDEPIVVTDSDAIPAFGLGEAAPGDAFARATSPKPDSAPIRDADFSVKARILLETEVLGHKVYYRRVKHVNELVIDRYVYAEKKAVLEVRHTLSATVDGHEIEVGFDGTYSYAALDGQLLTQKLRLI